MDAMRLRAGDCYWFADDRKLPVTDGLRGDTWRRGVAADEAAVMVRAGTGERTVLSENCAP